MQLVKNYLIKNSTVFNYIYYRFFVQQKLGIGRWKVEDCSKKINHKIDYANEDHCGPCGSRKIK